MNREWCLRSLVPAFLVLGTALLNGCGNSGQSVDPGVQQQTQAGKLEVVLGSDSASVDLGSIATTEYKGVAMVLLSDAWTAADLGADHTTLEFGFEGDDGFTPAGKGCADLPGSDLGQGYIDPVSRNLTWDEAFGLKGCYTVRATKTMTGHAPVTDAGADGG